MRLAAISDVHANLPALEGTLAAIEATEVEEIWCLGDVLGYGAQPDECVEAVRDRCKICLVGNHDLAVLGRLDASSFSEAAAEAVAWTRGKVSAQALDFVAGLEPAGERAGIALFHASPRDPIWEYVLSSEQADACLDVVDDRVSLIGHSHVALFFTRSPAIERGEVRGAQAADGARLDLGAGEWLLNPGSVGQPRDGDPRAAWLEIDTETSEARFHRVAYDIERAAASIVAAGLPERLAERLWAGL